MNCKSTFCTVFGFDFLNVPCRVQRHVRAMSSSLIVRLAISPKKVSVICRLVLCTIVTLIIILFRTGWKKEHLFGMARFNPFSIFFINVENRHNYMNWLTVYDHGAGQVISTLTFGFGFWIGNTGGDELGR